VILINEHTKRVDYLSQTYCGKTHDKKIADSETIHYPPHATLDQIPVSRVCATRRSKHSNPRRNREAKT